MQPIAPNPFEGPLVWLAVHEDGISVLEYNTMVRLTNIIITIIIINVIIIIKPV